MTTNNVIKRRSQVLGLDFNTNKCGECFIFEYNNAKDVLVMFKDYPCVVKCCFQSLKDGCVLNPMHPTFYEKGFMGVGRYSYKNKSHYKLWMRVLQRCYSPNYGDMRPSYEGVTMCNEWLNFQNFAKWCDGQKFFNAKDDNGKSYHLDKDILVKGNKIYSPETCCFVPQEINALLIRHKTRRGDLPVGVCFNKQGNNFKANFTCGGKTKHIGYFQCPEDAFNAYKVFKQSYIKSLAISWSGMIDEKVYNALVNYQVDFED